MLHLTLAGVAVLGTEVINGIKVILALYDGLGIEQGLAVLTFRGARLQLKEYSVCLTWHSIPLAQLIKFRFLLQIYKKIAILLPKRLFFSVTEVKSPLINI